MYTYVVMIMLDISSISSQGNKTKPTATGLQAACELCCVLVMELVYSSVTL